MKPCGGWLGRLVVSGACLGLVGCGGSDVPDPDSDATAVRDQPTQVVDRNAGGSAPAEAAAPEAAAPAAPAPAAAAAQPAVAAAPAEAAAATSAAEGAMPAEGDAAAPAAPALKADASATDELARLAAAPPAPVETPAAAPGVVEAGATSAEARPGPGRGVGMEGGEALAASGPGMPGPGMPGPGMPGAAGPAAPGGGVLGAPGMEGMGSGGGAGGDGVGANEPADFSRPSTAATAFLSALKARNKDRLAQAVARRAPTEAIEKHRETFAAITEVRIGDDELDALAKAMDGYKPVSQLQAESSGRMWIVIGRMDGNKYHQRKLTMRKEKEGWKLLDFSGVTEFNQSMNRRRR